MSRDRFSIHVLLESSASEDVDSCWRPELSVKLRRLHPRSEEWDSSQKSEAPHIEQEPELLQLSNWPSGRQELFRCWLPCPDSWGARVGLPIDCSICSRTA